MQHPLSDEEKELLIRFTKQMEKEDGNIKINAKITTSQQLHFTHNEKKKEISLEEKIPKEYHKFLDIFDEKKANQFSEEQVWDHKIEMKDSFIPKSFKNYNLTLAEQIELDKFLKENLEKGHLITATLWVILNMPLLVCILKYISNL